MLRIYVAFVFLNVSDSKQESHAETGSARHGTIVQFRRQPGLGRLLHACVQRMKADKESGRRRIRFGDEVEPEVTPF